MAATTVFYVTLPSDGSTCMTAFPENTVAQFKTLLPQTLDLSDGEWEVSLTEMMFPKNLENIDDVTEAMFVIMIPMNVTHTDPNTYERGQYHLINLGREKLIHAPILVAW